jgi:hypothetical protein
MISSAISSVAMEQGRLSPSPLIEKISADSVGEVGSARQTSMTLPELPLQPHARFVKKSRFVVQHLTSNAAKRVNQFIQPKTLGSPLVAQAIWGLKLVKTKNLAIIEQCNAAMVAMQSASSSKAMVHVLMKAFVSDFGGYHLSSKERRLIRALGLAVGLPSVSKEQLAEISQLLSNFVNDIMCEHLVYKLKDFKSKISNCNFNQALLLIEALAPHSSREVNGDTIMHLANALAEQVISPTEHEQTIRLMLNISKIADTNNFEDAQDRLTDAINSGILDENIDISSLNEALENGADLYHNLTEIGFYVSELKNKENALTQQQRDDLFEALREKVNELPEEMRRDCDLEL